MNAYGCNQFSHGRGCPGDHPLRGVVELELVEDVDLLGDEWEGDEFEGDTQRPETATPRQIGLALNDATRFFEEMQEDIISKGRDRFLEERVLRQAAKGFWIDLREATNRVGKKFQADHPKVNWRGIRKQANLLAHGYHKIDWKIVWFAMTETLPQDIALMRGLDPES